MYKHYIHYTYTLHLYITIQSTAVKLYEDKIFGKIFIKLILLNFFYRLPLFSRYYNTYIILRTQVEGASFEMGRRELYNATT